MSDCFVNVGFVPFVTVMSAFSNPLTVSLNVNVYVMLLAFVGFALGFIIMLILDVSLG